MMRGARLLAVLAALLALAAQTVATSAASAADWPQFRGPRGDGHTTETGLPLAWSEDHNVAWKIPLPGRGWSSPIVLGGKVWLTTAFDDRRTLHALGIDAATGETLHDVEVFRPAAWQEAHPENSYASPTPVAEAGRAKAGRAEAGRTRPGRIYVHFGAYGTAALDADTGEVVWRSQALQLQHEVGPGSSPILWRDLLIVNCDGTDQRFVAALDKATGELVWQAPRSVALDRKGTHLKAFSTPLVIHHAGRPQLVSPAAGQVSSYDPATGEEIWRVRYEGYSNVPRPVAGLGLVFVNTGYMKPHLLAIHPGGGGDVTDTHVRWSYHWQVSANPSPLLIGSRLYMVSDWGIASWLDARKGEDLWRERLKGRYYASPIHVGGRIYNFSLEGRSVVVEAGDTYRELASNTLDGKIRASPAVADRAIFVRTESHLYRLQELSAGD
ncbi:MAG: PQQ-binding-like beta-propeller repeat protein [Acidobacteriota bacterium]